MPHIPTQARPPIPGRSSPPPPLSPRGPSGVARTTLQRRALAPSDESRRRPRGKKSKMSSNSSRSCPDPNQYVKKLWNWRAPSKSHGPAADTAASVDGWRAAGVGVGPAFGRRVCGRGDCGHESGRQLRTCGTGSLVPTPPLRPRAARASRLWGLHAVRRESPPRGLGGCRRRSGRRPAVHTRVPPLLLIAASPTAATAFPRHPLGECASRRRTVALNRGHHRHCRCSP